MNIGYRKFHFTIEATEPIFLPIYKGSTFRGGFGNTFRRILCALKRKDCDNCMLKTSCVYAYVFETIPRSDTSLMNMGKYERVPHPFIIEPPEETTREYEPGEKVSFGLCLIGRAVDLLPYFILTFEELGSIGLGKGRGKYALLEVTTNESDGERTIYSRSDRKVRPAPQEVVSLPDSYEEPPGGTPDMITLDFITPTRIIYQRCFVDTLEFHVLIRHLFRRLQSLRYFHCGQEIAEWDHRHFISEASAVKIVGDWLSWRDWERYSSRQGKKMKMGGLVGKISYEGKIGPFLPLLRAGEIFHVGKGTSFGLGRYRILTGANEISNEGLRA